MTTYKKIKSAKHSKNTQLLLTFFLISIISNVSCSKDENNSIDSANFILASPVIQPDSLLPKDYTCDGESSTLPLNWTGYPGSTKYFALIMHHAASASDIHWYWVLYNIPVTVQNLEKNATGIGILGNNSVNGNIGYAPPCSQGPGFKKYTYTLYALSEPATPSVPDSEVNRVVLLASIKNITLASATLSVIYSRDF